MLYLRKWGCYNLNTQIASKHNKTLILTPLIHVTLSLSKPSPFSFFQPHKALKNLSKPKHSSSSSHFLSFPFLPLPLKAQKSAHFSPSKSQNCSKGGARSFFSWWGGSWRNSSKFWRSLQARK